MRWPVEKAAPSASGDGENIDEASDPVLKKALEVLREKIAEH